MGRWPTRPEFRSVASGVCLFVWFGCSFWDPNYHQFCFFGCSALFASNFHAFWVYVGFFCCRTPYLSVSFVSFMKRLFHCLPIVRSFTSKLCASIYILVCIVVIVRKVSSLHGVIIHLPLSLCFCYISNFPAICHNRFYSTFFCSWLILTQKIFPPGVSKVFTIKYLSK